MKHSPRTSTNRSAGRLSSSLDLNWSSKPRSTRTLALPKRLRFTKLWSNTPLLLQEPLTSPN